MKIFVYVALFWASFAQAAISPMDQALKNVASRGNETVGQYIERNKNILPKALIEKWTKDPAVKALPMIPIEVSNTQGKLIFYFKDTSKKQHTMVWRAERNNLFTFDGTAIPAAQFIDQNNFIRNITGRDYKLRKMVERADPKMWAHAFRTVYLPSVSQLKTQDKERFLAYHRSVLMFWLKARSVATHKKMVASASESKSFAEFLFSAVFASAEAEGKCIERGYIGISGANGCAIKGDEDCGSGSGKRSCNATIYGRSSDGKLKCGAMKNGDDDCAASIATDSPLAKMDESVFAQVNAAMGLKATLSAAEKIEAEKFARSFLKVSGDLKLTELDAAYKVFQDEVSEAYALCRTEFDKQKGTPTDAALRKKCLGLKKQEVLLAAGLDGLKTDPKFTYTKDQVQTCDNSALPTCDTPEAVGQASCYKGISCHTTGLLVGAGAAGIAGLIYADNKSKGGNNTGPVTPPVWPPQDPCNVDGAPTIMCSDPEKCKTPYDFSTVYNTCKPPVCGVGQSYSEMVKGCVDHCTIQNMWVEKTKKDNPNLGVTDSEGRHTGLGFLPMQPLNCFNAGCTAPKIWNPWAKECQVAQDCASIVSVGGSTGMAIGGSSVAPNIAISNVPFVRDQFNQCVVPPCGYGTEQDWYTGKCEPYASWKTCPGSALKVVNLDNCNLYTPMVIDTTGATSGSTGGTR